MKPTKPYKFLLPFLLLLHLFLILKGGYFLSPEFTLYPYLTKNGFLPYLNLLDQHLPVILFGPLSLPSFLTQNPFPLLPLFLLLLLLTDILFYLSLVRLKAPHSLLSTALFIFISYYFQANFLWLETFICLFLALVLFLSPSKSNWSKLALGFFLSLAVLTKPTIAPALFLLLLSLSITINRYLISGFLLPLIITALYLIKFDIINHFYSFVVGFNSQQYLSLSQKYPQIRQILALLLASALPFFFLLQKKRFLSLFACLFCLILAFPRFEYFHLQPYFLLLIFSFSQIKWSPFQLKTIKIVALIIFLIISFKISRYSYGNFYLQPNTITTAQYSRQLPGSTIYLLGGSDLIYPLSGKVPPSLTYLPSLPWYLGNKNLQERVIKALSQSPQTPILLNPSSTINGINILDSSPLLHQYIKANYTQVDTITNYQVYFHQLLAIKSPP